jgi:hypothetical protein
VLKVNVTVTRQTLNLSYDSKITDLSIWFIRLKENDIELVYVYEYKALERAKKFHVLKVTNVTTMRKLPKQQFYAKVYFKNLKGRNNL